MTTKSELYKLVAQFSEIVEDLQIHAILHDEPLELIVVVAVTASGDLKLITESDRKKNPS